MSSISAAGGSSLTYYARNKSGSASANTSTVDAVQREQDLTQQLDDKLTKQISRIRQYITPGGSPSDNAERTGTILDIRA